MRHPTFVLSLSAILPLAACGGDSHESLTKESIDLMNQLAGTLEKVTDKASAEAAKPKVEALGGQLKALQDRMKAVGEPDEATGKALMGKYQEEMAKAQQRMMQAAMGLASKPEAAAVLKDAMSKIEGG